VTSSERDVLAANDSFYRAFAARDLEAMNRLWAKKELCVCVHPGWQALHGRREVMASWRAILEGDGAPDIRCEEARAIVLEAAALVSCVERIDDGDGALVATNVFVLEDGAWRMIHHQAAPFVERPLPTDSPEALN
jgi:ketosteroid isomerase-like protein